MKKSLKRAYNKFIIFFTEREIVDTTLDIKFIKLTIRKKRPIQEKQNNTAAGIY